MKILNIIRSEPDDMTSQLVEAFAKDENSFKKVALYQDNVDWSGLVNDIFSFDKVICWW